MKKLRVALPKVGAHAPSRLRSESAQLSAEAKRFELSGSTTRKGARWEVLRAVWSRLGFETWILLLISCAMPRADLPTGYALVCSICAWVAFAASLFPPSSLGRAGLLWQLAAGASLATLATLDPPTWLAVAPCLMLLGWAAARSAYVRKCWLSVGLGLVAPCLLYAGLWAVGDDQRAALRMAFRVSRSPAQLVAGALAVSAIGGVTLVILSRHDLALGRLLNRLARVMSGLLFLILLARFVCLASVASLPSDLSIWSEAPALTNLLKLHNGALFYGPLEQVDSYSYSPGLEFTQYALLRPFHLELSLRAHRVLGLLWQLTSAWLLARALWPWLRERLRPVLGDFAYPTLLVAIANVTVSSLVAPYVHPDHLLMLCFSAALCLCLSPEPFGRGTWPALVVLPATATLFKLTGAGIGVGLVLAVLFERRWRALGALSVAAILAVSSIPLCNALLGHFTLYAIELQAAHPMLWGRLLTVPATQMGLLFAVACGAVGGAPFAYVSSQNTRAAVRCLLLTGGLALPSLVAFCKLGGRENSLLPFAIGGSVALLVVLGDAPTALQHKSRTHRVGRATTLLVLVMFWTALPASHLMEPVVASERKQLTFAYEREVAWLRQELARGRHPLSQGTAAWIEVGRRDAPRDRLNSAGELELGHWPDALETRLLNGTYDGLYLTVATLNNSPLLLRLRAPLERQYKVVEPRDLRGEWPTDNTGFVILERR